ncbi:mannose-1-phosphate guanylyltransferase/mannose-6-phosphate isomerase [Legionella lytica]|uniref:mannose-1-phosphate guanylyltransferase n=1 Tax=Legionella lytica TaxID=96232 RepID=A0ABW8D7A4_9GAMM
MNSTISKIVPVILSGGEGTRLWPVSRLHHPKPFIKLQDGYTILQRNFLKARDIGGIHEILTVTNHELLFKTLDNYQELNNDGIELSFILEPYACNTCPAIISAALFIAHKYNEDTLMLILPADHLVKDQEAFNEAVQNAADLANQGNIITFGIKPSEPHTGYGYIEAKGCEVLRFIEKPSYEKAVEYLSMGNFLWNSGMFCCKAGILLEEAQNHCPEIYAAVKHCFEASKLTCSQDYNKLSLDKETFKHIANQSIDYAILEKSTNRAVVACDIGWSDLGSWDAIANLTHADKENNQVDAEAILKNVSNCYIRGNNRLIAGLGLNNLVIIDTADALLISNREQVQDIKLLYQQLKKDNHEAHKSHRTVYRPWGSYSILDEGPGFKIKHIEVTPQASLSLQKHNYRSEHWVVVEGKAKACLDDKIIYLNPNESMYVPIGAKHQLENPFDERLILIEVQCGSHLDEDDIVRFSDMYGRC